MVDDDPGSVSVFTRMLRGDGHFVIAVQSAIEALAVLDRKITRVEIIVSDINMPDMSGVEFYQEVERRNPDLAKRIVFITGGLSSRSRVNFLAGIPNPLLEKPFKTEQLFQAVASVAPGPEEE